MRIVLVGLAIWAGAVFAAPASLLWQGEVSWTLPAATVSFNTKAELGWTIPFWFWKATAEIKDGLWTGLSFSGSGKVGFLEVFPAVYFDPQEPKFSGATMGWKHALGQGTVLGVARLEEKGFGWGLSYLGGRGEVLQRLRLRFNLKRYLDEILKETFSPTFSFLEALLQIPLDCCGTSLSLRFSYTKTGFDQLSLGLRLPRGFPCDLGFWAHVLFKVDAKEARIFPSLLYTPPAGLLVFPEVNWNFATHTFEGIKIYAFGLQGEIGPLRYRTFASLAEDEVNFVKDPYWEVITLSLAVPACCTEKGEIQMEFYFGDTGLFGLGEVNISTKLLVAQGFWLSFGVDTSFSRAQTVLHFGWKAAF